MDRHPIQNKCFSTTGKAAGQKRAIGNRILSFVFSVACMKCGGA
jgi:hypothetical protein